MSSRPGLSGSDVEWHYLDMVRAVRRATTLPLAVKLSPHFSAVANMAGQLVEAGADGLVLFNRFYQPDLDPGPPPAHPRGGRRLFGPRRQPFAPLGRLPPEVMQVVVRVAGGV